MATPTVVEAWIAPELGRGGIDLDRIYIKTPFRLKDQCKSLPGARWHPEMKAWHIPATAAAAGEFVQAFHSEKVTMDGALAELIDSAHRQVKAQEFKEADDLPDIPVRTSAWLHQRRAFHFAKELDAAMLAMDMGTGKSLTAIALLQEWDARVVLILCPVSVVGVWPKQFETHALDPGEWLIAAPRNNLRTDVRSEILGKAILKAKKTGQRCVCVVNYEASWRDRIEYLLRAIKWDVVIADESHRIKSPGGKQSRFATAMRRNSRRRLALTGTPMPHSPMDLYAQYRFLDPGIFGTSKNRYQNRYCIMGGYENRQIKGWQNEAELTRKFSSVAFVVSKEDALPDLPQKLPPSEREFSLGAKALAAYTALAKDFVAGVDEGLIVANNSLSRIMRFRQITSGHAKTEDGLQVHLDDGREKLLADILANEIPEGEPVVVFAVFHQDLDAIERTADGLGLRYGELSGRRRDGLADDSTMAPDIGVLGCQLKSGGVGIDLTRSAYAIYYSIGYELGDYQQSTDRLHRPGQTRAVTYLHLIAENAPIDRVMFKALRDRKSVVDAVLGAAKEQQL